MSEMADLIGAIVENDEAFEGAWDTFSVIIGLDKDGDPNNSYGYLYADREFTAIAPAPWDLETQVAAYLRSVYGDGPRPLKMLIQFDRNSGRFNVQFEDKDPKRWAVTPADIHGFIESLRPKFE